MAIEFKDYYQILGVSRSASAEEIRKTFRKLARQFHPDVARNDTSAETQFKEVNEAYEVLGDPSKRKRYDALASEWRSGAGLRSAWNPSANGAGRPGSQQGAGFEFRFGGTGFSDFFEQVFGAMGGRARPGFERQPENHRNGPAKGEDVESNIVVSLQEVLRGSTRPITIQRSRTCTRCQGAGHIYQLSCPNCHGAGQTKQIERYQMKIPPGVRGGQRLRLPGQGDPGLTRGTPGDLYLRVHFERHPDFRAEGEHLIYDLDVTPWEAVLGSHAIVPTLEGQLNVRVPPGSQNGQRLRLRGHGLPTKNAERGDLFAVLRIQVPVVIGDEERSLWQKLARTSPFRARTRPH